MGGCLSSMTSPATILEKSLVDGNDNDYHERFVEMELLGAGEFAQVKLVHDMSSVASRTGPPNQYACKMLKKGVTFRDNTLYAPLNPTVLRGECKILRVLNGAHHCLKLICLYESPTQIFVVTEFCQGGEMMQYLVKNRIDLNTGDVSRISFQLLDAVAHCHRHNVIHRDIKPENVMFKTGMEGSELRLIDFGSSTIDGEGDAPEDGDGEVAGGGGAGGGGAVGGGAENGGGARESEPLVGGGGGPEAAPDGGGGGSSAAAVVPLMQHTTFAGSAFYISPEMFQRTYTAKTDVWSVGATLYVLVAGYPAENLQKAFNILQTSKDRNLRSLPNLPEELLPDSYFDMMEDLLKYRHKQRRTAEEMLDCEFVKFHLANGGDGDDEEGEGIGLDEIAAVADGEEQGGDSVGALRRNSVGGGGTSTGTKRVSLVGSVQKHSLYLGYQKFERAVTTLLATVLTAEKYEELLDALNERIREGEGENARRLNVVKVLELREVLTKLGLDRAVEMMGRLPDAASYDGFAYHVALLRQFLRRSDGTDGVSSRAALTSNGSNLETRGAARSVVPAGAEVKRHDSVHGTNVWERWMKGSRRGGSRAGAAGAGAGAGSGGGGGSFRPGQGEKDELNSSSHL